MGRLTTHVLDIARGKPGAGIVVKLYKLDGARLELAVALTNHDGRCDRPLLEGPALQKGSYEIVFLVGNYFRAQGDNLPEPLFIDEVVLRFGICDADAHYHVPLLVSPWGYSTYRGS